MLLVFVFVVAVVVVVDVDDRGEDGGKEGKELCPGKKGDVRVGVKDIRIS